MEWDDEAVAMVAKAPRFVRRFAVGNLEDYAQQNGYDRVTEAVVREQMAAAGVGGVDGAGSTGRLRRLFGRKS
jgi:Proto-chlorophyllide reductase 57 kD subunit